MEYYPQRQNLASPSAAAAAAGGGGGRRGMVPPAFGGTGGGQQQQHLVYPESGDAMMNRQTPVQHQYPSSNLHSRRENIHQAHQHFSDQYPPAVGSRGGGGGGGPAMGGFESEMTTPYMESSVPYRHPNAHHHHHPPQSDYVPNNSSSIHNHFTNPTSPHYPQAQWTSPSAASQQQQQQLLAAHHHHVDPHYQNHHYPSINNHANPSTLPATYTSRMQAARGESLYGTTSVTTMSMMSNGYHQQNPNRNPNHHMASSSGGGGGAGGTTNGARQRQRNGERYHNVFFPDSRTISEEGSRTRRTTSDDRREDSRSDSMSTSSRSGSNSFRRSSSSSETDSDDGEWEETIMTAINDMAGELKKIGGINCNQAGPDGTEVQLRLNLPVPKQLMDQIGKDARRGITTAMATLSPKKCQYDDLDGVDMEENFRGTMDQLHGNMMPMYKSLFESQSSDDDDDDESRFGDSRRRHRRHDDNGGGRSPQRHAMADATTVDEEESETPFGDPRFINDRTHIHQQNPPVGRVYGTTPFDRSRPNQSLMMSPILPKMRGDHGDQMIIGHQLQKQQQSGRIVVPEEIIISDHPSDISSNGSWHLTSPRDQLRNAEEQRKRRQFAENDIDSPNENMPSFDEAGPRHDDPNNVQSSRIDINKAMATISNAIANNSSTKRDASWIAATRGKLELIDRESPDMDKKIQIAQVEEPKVTEKPQPREAENIVRKEKEFNPGNPMVVPEDIEFVNRNDDDIRFNIVHSCSDLTMDIKETEVPIKFPMTSVHPSFSGDELMRGEPKRVGEMKDSKPKSSSATLSSHPGEQDPAMEGESQSPKHYPQAEIKVANSVDLIEKSNGPRRDVANHSTKTESVKENRDESILPANINNNFVSPINMNTEHRVENTNRNETKQLPKETKLKKDIDKIDDTNSTDEKHCENVVKRIESVLSDEMPDDELMSRPRRNECDLESSKEALLCKKTDNASDQMEVLKKNLIVGSKSIAAEDGTEMDTTTSKQAYRNENKEHFNLKLVAGSNETNTESELSIPEKQAQVVEYDADVPDDEVVKEQRQDPSSRKDHSNELCMRVSEQPSFEMQDNEEAQESSIENSKRASLPQRLSPDSNERTSQSTEDKVRDSNDRSSSPESWESQSMEKSSLDGDSADLTNSGSSSFEDRNANSWREEDLSEESRENGSDPETSSIEEQYRHQQPANDSASNPEESRRRRKNEKEIGQLSNYDEAYDEDASSLDGSVTANRNDKGRGRHSQKIQNAQESISTSRIRNQIDIDEENVEIRYLSVHSRSIQQLASSGATVSTTETPRRLQSMKTFETKETAAAHSHASLPRFLPTSYSTETPFTTQLTTSYTQDTPLRSASTLSTVRTFERDTRDSPDNEEIISILSSLHDKKNSAVASSALSKAYRLVPKSKSKYSSLPSLQQVRPTSLLSWVQRKIWSMILLLFSWLKHVIGIGSRKSSTKINFSNDQINVLSERTLRPELINKSRCRTASESHMDPDADEVGTCVESIVPDVPENLEVMSVCSARSSTSKLFKRRSSLVSTTSKLRRRRRRGTSSYSENEINWLSKNDLDDMDDQTILSYLD